MEREMKIDFSAIDGQLEQAREARRVEAEEREGCGALFNEIMGRVEKFGTPITVSYVRDIENVKITFFPGGQITGRRNNEPSFNCEEAYKSDPRKALGFALRALLHGDAKMEVGAS